MGRFGPGFKTVLVETPGSGLFDREGVERAANYHDAKGKPAYRYARACTRCGGEGGAVQWQPTGYTCYRCGGDCVDPSPGYLPLYTADRLAKLNVTRDKVRAKKAAKAEAARIEREAADEAARVARADALKSDPTFTALAKYADRNEFIAELLGKYRVRDLSDAQIAAAQKVIDRLAELDRLAAASDYLGAVGERVPVSGVVKLSKCIHRAEPGAWRGGIPDVSRYIVKVETDAGCVVVWFTASPLREGARAEGKATVKACETRDGIKQTTVKNFRAVKAKA